MADFEQYSPVLDNPYPENWSEISDFRYTSHLYLARAKSAIRAGADREAEYLLGADYACECLVDGKPWRITIPSGMFTDLASVPRLGRLFVERVGPHLEAAIVHDFLFIAWQDLPDTDDRRPTPRRFDFANEVMNQAMIAAGVGPVERFAINVAVRSFVARGVFLDPNSEPRYVRVPPPPPSPKPTPRPPTA